MAWIACHCKCGCKRSSYTGPPRSAHSSPGLCNWCKRGEHIAGVKQERLVQAITTVVLRKRLIVGVTRVVKR